MTDEVNEEFILAEQAYEDAKTSIQTELGKLTKWASRSVTESDVSRLRAYLDSASVRLQNAAKELSRAEFLRSKEYLSQAARVSREQPRLLAERESLEREIAFTELEIERTNQELEFAETVESKLQQARDEREALAVKLEVVQAERERIETRNLEIRNFGDPGAELAALVAKTRSEIASSEEELVFAQQELAAVTAHAESVRAEAGERQEELRALQALAERKETEIRKARDEGFLRAIDWNRLVDELEKTRKLRTSIDEEIEEVENFEVKETDRVDQKAHEFELAAIEAETARLAADIERVREQQFRARMRI